MTVPNPVGPPAEPPAPAPRLLRIAEVCQRLGCSRRQVYNLIRDGRFPRPVRYTPGFVVWPESVVDDWVRTVAAPVALN